MSEVSEDNQPVAQGGPGTVPAAPDPHPSSAPALDHHGGAKTRGLRPIPRSSLNEGKFGWLLRGLPGCLTRTDEQIQALVDALVEPADAGGSWGATSRDNPAIPAVYTYLAQLLDHDLTFDAASDSQRRDDPDALHNFRTPRLDLDSVYGSGPKVSPHLYQKDDPDKLLLGGPAGPDGKPDGSDLPRNSEGIALLGDPRDDVHLVISQLHLVLLHFHNAVVDRVRNNPSLLPAGSTVFDTAQQLVRWHWQWVVVHDLLPRLVGPAILAEVLPPAAGEAPGKKPDKRSAKPRLLLFTPHNRPYVPLEFSGALYRFGHTMVRNDYRLNASTGLITTFSARPTPGERDDLRGHRPIPPDWVIDWALFAPTPGGNPQPSRLLDSLLAPDLRQLPASVDTARRSLAFLNIRSGQRYGLPSGESFAAAVAAALAARGGQLTGPTLAPGETGMSDTPLWLWMLKEAELRTGGQHLGPVARPRHHRSAARAALARQGLLPARRARLDPHTWQHRRAVHHHRPAHDLGSPCSPLTPTACVGAAARSGAACCGAVRLSAPCGSVTSGSSTTTTPVGTC
jgi:hypothetical protein